VSAEATEILERALALPEPERVTLLERLADSIAEQDGELSPDWTAEITRRIEAVERGVSALIPGDEVEARIQRALGRA
jgi:putative addiction module component (TIGR02574 family)